MASPISGQKQNCQDSAFFNATQPRSRAQLRVAKSIAEFCRYILTPAGAVLEWRRKSEVFLNRIQVVHPRCTIELASLPPRYLRQFPAFGPPQRPQFGFRNPREERFF